MKSENEHERTEVLKILEKVGWVPGLVGKLDSHFEVSSR